MPNYKYINPFTDFGFKKIFGEEANKDLLISFLNELLAYEDQKIKTLTYKKLEQLPESEQSRKVIYDLYCENNSGEKFIVEMQRVKQKYFKDRMLYYSTFAISEQAPKGKIENQEGEKVYWDYKLKAIYVIGLLEFKMPLDIKNEGKLLSRHKLLDIDTHTIFYDKLTFITLELEYFNKNIDELETNFDKWIYILKNLDKFERIPEKIKDKIFEKLFKVAEYAKLTAGEQLEYELSLSYYRDLHSSIKTAKLDGKEEAYDELLPKIKEARKNTEKERAEKEKAQQLVKEEHKRLVSSAKALKQAGIPIKEIIKITGLSHKEIENL